MYKTVSPIHIGHMTAFKDAAEVAAKVGFEGFWFHPWDMEISVSETKELLAKTGLRAAGFGLPVAYWADQTAFDADFSKLEGYVRYAVDIGAERRCAIHVYPSSDTYTWQENYEFHRTRLKKCSEVLKEYGIILGLEFVSTPSMRRGVKYEFIHNLEQMLELCEDIGTGNCGLLLDVWHWDMGGYTKADFKKFSGDQVALVHIDDAPEGIPIEEQIDNQRKLPGETGVLKIAEFFDGLKSIGYDGPVLAEPFEPKLSEMSYEKAFEIVMDSFNKVWID